MDKRYQVFVSSTFQDLQEERQEVMQALLELDCMPAGMELFPAANEDQWTLIKKVIDDCDYYIVVIGGRYGSIGPEGLSFTEMEYRYALEQNKPVIAFLHKDPGSIPTARSEQSPEGKERLQTFRKLAEKKMVRYWTTPADLGSAVSRSVVRLIKTNPAIGWVKADQVPDKDTTEEILRLRKRIEDLEEQLRTTSTEAPKGAEDLAQGEDEFEINFTFEAQKRGHDSTTCQAKVTATWNEVFSAISPWMMDEASDLRLYKRLNAFVRTAVEDDLSKKKAFKGFSLSDFELSLDDFQTIKVQLSALGLIMKSQRSRSVKDKDTYWTLTPYGENAMMRLRALRKT